MSFEAIVPNAALEPWYSSVNLSEAVQHLIITAAAWIKSGLEQMPLCIPETAIIPHTTRTSLRLNTLEWITTLLYRITKWLI